MTHKDIIKSIEKTKKEMQSELEILQQVSLTEAKEYSCKKDNWLKDIVSKAHDDVSKWSKEKYEFLKKQIEIK